jgi:hypothetical protein
MPKQNTAIAFSNLMLGNPKRTIRERRLIKKSPYGDFDKDKIINIADCKPYNKKKHITAGDIYSQQFAKGTPQNPSYVAGQGYVGTSLDYLIPPTSFPQSVPCFPTQSVAPPPAFPTTPSAFGGVGSTGRVSGSGGGSYNPTTQTYTSPTGVQQSVAQSYVPIGTKIEEVKPVAPSDKLGLGTSIVTAYKPFTAAELVEIKEIEKQSKTEAARQKLREIASRIQSPAFNLLPTWRETKVPETIIVKEKYPTKSTIITKVPNLSELYSMGFVEAAGQMELGGAGVQIQSNLNIISQREAERIGNEIITKAQEKINSKQGQFKTQEEADEFIKQINKEAEEKFYSRHTAALTSYVKKATEKSEAESKRISAKMSKLIDKRDYIPALAGGLLTGVAYGGLSVLAPPVGWTLIGVAGAQALTSVPETIKYAKQQPLTFAASLGGTLAGGLAGGIAGAKIKNVYITQPRIKAAIENSRAVSPYKDLTLTRQLKELKISNEGLRDLQTHLDKGNSIRLFNTKLVAKSTAEKEYLPNVKGKFIEVLSRDGRVIERINLGNTITKYKGKTFSSQSISDAVGKLEGDTAKYYTRTLITQVKKGKVKPIQYYETLEKVQLKEQQKVGLYQKLRGEAEVKMIREVQKPKPADITQTLKLGKPTEFQVDKFLAGWGKAKPYGKAQIEYAGKTLKARTKIIKQNLPESMDYTSYLIPSKKFEMGKGLSIFERTMQEMKLSRKMKSWDINKMTELKPIIYKTAKAAKIAEPVMPEPFRMEAYIKAFVKQRQMPSQVPSFVTYETAYGLAPQMAKVGNVGDIVKALVGTTAISMTRVSAKEVQVQKQLLKVQQVQMQKLNQMLGLEQAQKLEVKQVQMQKLQVTQLQNLQVKQLQQQKLQQKLQLTQMQKLAQMNVPKIPFLKLTFVPPPPFTQKMPRYKEPGKVKQLSYEKQMKKQARAYQASVGAVVLGLYAKKGYKPQKKFTGTELRYMIRDEQPTKKSYAKQLNKIFA